MKRPKKSWPWLILSLAIILLDQLTKYAVLSHLAPSTHVTILPFLNFIMNINSGASFGFLNQYSGWQVYLLADVSMIISLILIVWLCRLPWQQWWIGVPVSLVLGGALGNLIDRVRFGYVIDFIDFHIRSWHYATFNIADMAVSIGATWLIVRLIYESIARKS